MFNKLKQELDIYIRNKDYDKTAFLKYVISNIQNKANYKPITNELVLTVLKLELKNINVEIENATIQQRDDIISKKEIEKQIIIKYIPEEMNQIETIKEIRTLIKELNIQNEKQFGLIIKELKTRFKSKVNMEIVNRVIKTTIMEYFLEG